MAAAFMLSNMGWAFEPINKPADHALAKYSSSWGAARSYGEGQRGFMIVVRDLHCHYGVQKAIEHILKELQQHLGERVWIGMEGAVAKVDLSLWESMRNKAVRDLLLEELMRAGQIGGSEAFAARYPEMVFLDGMEDPALYGECRARIPQLLSNAAQGSLQDLSAALKEERLRQDNSTLSKINFWREKYNAGNLESTVYARILIDFAPAQERAMLLQALSGNAELLAGTHQSNPENIGLEESLDTLEEATLAYHLVNREEEQREEVYRTFRALQHAVSLSCTPKEVRQLLSVWQRPTLRQYLAELGCSRKFLHLADQAEGTFRQICRFYSTENRRSRILAELAIQRCTKSGVGRGIMVAGGYHTDTLVSHLRAAGWGYLVIDPQYTPDQSNNPYFQLLVGREISLNKFYREFGQALALEPFSKQQGIWDTKALARENFALRIYQKMCLPQVIAQTERNLPHQGSNKPTFRKPNPLWVVAFNTALPVVMISALSFLEEVLPWRNWVGSLPASGLVLAVGLGIAKYLQTAVATWGPPQEQERVRQRKSKQPAGPWPGVAMEVTMLIDIIINLQHAQFSVASWYLALDAWIQEHKQAPLVILSPARLIQSQLLEVLGFKMLAGFVFAHWQGTRWELFLKDWKKNHLPGNAIHNSLGYEMGMAIAAAVYCFHPRFLKQWMHGKTGMSLKPGANSNNTNQDVNIPGIKIFKVEIKPRTLPLNPWRAVFHSKFFGWEHMGDSVLEHSLTVWDHLLNLAWAVPLAFMTAHAILVLVFALLPVWAGQTWLYSSSLALLSGGILLPLIKNHLRAQVVVTSFLKKTFDPQVSLNGNRIMDLNKYPHVARMTIFLFKDRQLLFKVAKEKNELWINQAWFAKGLENDFLSRFFLNKILATLEYNLASAGQEESLEERKWLHRVTQFIRAHHNDLVLGSALFSLALICLYLLAMPALGSALEMLRAHFSIWGYGALLTPVLGKIKLETLPKFKRVLAALGIDKPDYYTPQNWRVFSANLLRYPKSFLQSIPAETLLRMLAAFYRFQPMRNPEVTAYVVGKWKAVLHSIKNEAERGRHVRRFLILAGLASLCPPCRKQNAFSGFDLALEYARKFLNQGQSPLLSEVLESIQSGGFDENLKQHIERELANLQRRIRDRAARRMFKQLLGSVGDRITQLASKRVNRALLIMPLVGCGSPLLLVLFFGLWVFDQARQARWGAFLNEDDYRPVLIPMPFSFENAA